MINNDYKNNIFEFIVMFGQVTESQVRAMFSQCSADIISYDIESLAIDKVIAVSENSTPYNSVGNRTLCAKRRFAIDKEIQKLITYSASVLAAFGEKLVRSYFITEYPTQLFFTTSEHLNYDVTVIDPAAVATTVQAANRYFKSFTLPGMTDTTNHIAVVFSKEDAEKVGKTGVFSHYAIINGKTYGAQIYDY